MPGNSTRARGPRHPFRRLYTVRLATNLAATIYGLVYGALVLLINPDTSLINLVLAWGLGVFVLVLPFGFAIQARLYAPLQTAWKAHHQGSGIPPASLPTVQKRLLNLPAWEFVLTVILWDAALLTFPCVVQFTGAEFPAVNMMHVVIGGNLTGILAAILNFYRVERVLRDEFYPVFLPDGRLSAVKGVFYTPVWLRIAVLVLSTSVVPLIVAAVIVGTGTGTTLAVLFLLVSSAYLALVQTRYILEAVSVPIGRLLTRMEHLQKGDLNVAMPVEAADALGRVGEGFNLMVQGLREREFIRDTFGRYVTRQVMEAILGGRLELGGELRHATVLFGDIRGFTTLAEKLPPAEVVSILNDFLDIMVEAVVEQGGTLDKFIGDAIMATFGVPLEQPDHARRAAAAALAIAERVAARNQERTARGEPPLHAGIGICTGELIAGNIGSKKRMEYTVIGDTVNTAARIEQLTKDCGRPVLASEATVQALGGAFTAEFVTETVLKGKAVPVRVYALGRPPPPPEAAHRI